MSFHLAGKACSCYVSILFLLPPPPLLLLFLSLGPIYEFVSKGGSIIFFREKLAQKKAFHTTLCNRMNMGTCDFETTLGDLDVASEHQP